MHKILRKSIGGSAHMAAWRWAIHLDADTLAATDPVCGFRMEQWGCGIRAESDVGRCAHLLAALAVCAPRRARRLCAAPVEHSADWLYAEFILLASCCPAARKGVVT